MQSQVESEIQSLAGEKLESEQTQKTNLEEQNHHKHHNSKKHKKSHHRRSNQRHAHSLMQTEEAVSGTPAATQQPVALDKKNTTAPAKVVPKPAPKASNLLNTKAKNQD